MEIETGKWNSTARIYDLAIGSGTSIMKGSVNGCHCMKIEREGQKRKRYDLIKDIKKVKIIEMNYG